MYGEEPGVPGADAALLAGEESVTWANVYI